MNSPTVAPRRHQRGGTFLGLVIGLLIGLGGALAVAVYVAKVPTPLFNKNPSRTAEQEAAENEKNKNWNPNAAMQSKVPIKPLPGSEAAGDAAAKAEEAKPMIKTEPTTAKAEAKTPDAAASAAKASRERADREKAEREKTEQAKADREKADREKADRKAEDAAKDPREPKEPKLAKVDKDRPLPSSSDPIGDFAKPTSSPTKADPFIYQVQTGAFRSPDEAESQRAKLALMGVDARVTEREQSGRTVYRVRTGPFDQRGDAERLRERLDGSGFESVLVRIQR